MRMGIPSGFDPRGGDFQGRATCKRALLEEVGFRHDGPMPVVLGSVGRLDYHKGCDILADAMKSAFREGLNVVLIGNGQGYQIQVDEIQSLLRRFPDRVFFKFEYDERFGRRVFAGSDFLLVPSRYESCGTTDLIAQLFGCLPIVHSVGGLVKIRNRVTGFAYRGGSDELLETIREAVRCLDNDSGTIRRMQRAAVDLIHARFTWDHVFRERYLPLYRRAIAQNQPATPD